MQSSCKRLLLLVSFPAIQFNCYSCFRKVLKKKYDFDVWSLSVTAHT